MKIKFTPRGELLAEKANAWWRRNRPDTRERERAVDEPLTGGADRRSSRYTLKTGSDALERFGPSGRSKETRGRVKAEQGRRAPDNNKAEAGLRRVALGRANFLFVGSEDAGHDLAVLYTLVASCEKNGVNPVAYLTDVLTRVQRQVGRLPAMGQQFFDPIGRVRGDASLLEVPSWQGGARRVGQREEAGAGES